MNEGHQHGPRGAGTALCPKSITFSLNPREKMQALASRRTLAARPAVRAARPAARTVKAMAFKVTLKTPSGACL
jgi:hypothetical protein